MKQEFTCYYCKAGRCTAPQGTPAELVFHPECFIKKHVTCEVIEKS